MRYLLLLLLPGCANGIPFLPAAIDPFQSSPSSTGGGGGIVSEAANLWLVVIPVVMVLVAYALPATRPAVVRLLSAVFGLIAIPFEVLAALLKRAVPAKWRPKRWDD